MSAPRGRPANPETKLARELARALGPILQGQQAPAEADQPAAPQGANRLVVRNRYGAAGNGPRLAGWKPPASGPNRALEGLQTIRNRARDTTRNDWTGASASQKWATNLIGIGITPRWKRIKGKERKQALTDLWTDFVANADADGALNFYGLQTLAVKAFFEGGECFIRRRSRFLDEGLPVPVQFQLLEAEMVPVFDATAFTDLPANHYIRSGIEFNKRGRRIAYWVYKDHPGDPVVRSGGITGISGDSPSRDSLVRIPADEIAHLYEPTRPGQLRGVPLLASVLPRLRKIEDYDDATLTRQQLANLIVAFIVKKLPAMTGDESLNPLTGQEDAEGEDSAGRPLMGLTPGLIQELDEGKEVQWSNPPEAGTTYSDYMRTQHLGTAAASGLPYELFSGDIKDISDRTLRVIINEFRRLAEQRQWQLIIPQMCERCIRWFAEAALLAGLISVDEFDDVRRVEWSPHGWAHIHPVQDPQGKELEVKAGFRSRSSVIGERGDDPEIVDQERADDQAREKELGLYADPSGQLDANGEPVAPPAPANDPAAQEAAAAANSLLQAFARFETAQAARAAAPAPAPVAPNITANITLPPTTIQNQIEMPTPTITVEGSTIEMPTPVVNVSNSVEPTPVTVQNNIEPTPVTVHNEVQPAEVKVSLPKRKSETTVLRDANGEIKRSTTIEEDTE